MKSVLVFGMIALIASVSFLQITLAFETEQEPEPPQIPEPSPAPEPIRMPDPAPAPDPFPEESDSEKVKRLTQENDNLKQENSNLQSQISALKNDKSRLQAEIFELNASDLRNHLPTLMGLKITDQFVIEKYDLPNKEA